MSRKLSREAAYKMIYSLGFPESPTDSKELLITASEGQANLEQDYVENIFDTAVLNLEKIDEIITKYLKSFSFDRLFKADLAALRLGIAEMLMKETEAIVAIDAAVSIVKKYGTEKSAGFVNGVLSSILEKGI